MSEEIESSRNQWAKTSEVLAREERSMSACSLAKVRCSTTKKIAEIPRTRTQKETLERIKGLRIKNIEALLNHVIYISMELVELKPMVIRRRRIQ